MTIYDLTASRAVYWQAIRDVCAEIRKTPPHMTEWLESRRRVLRHDYEQWRVAFDALNVRRAAT